MCVCDLLTLLCFAQMQDQQVGDAFVLGEGQTDSRLLAAGLSVAVHPVGVAIDPISVAIDAIDSICVAVDSVGDVSCKKNPADFRSSVLLQCS